MSAEEECQCLWCPDCDAVSSTEGDVCPECGSEWAEREFCYGACE